ncbi:MAG: hypothetical protein ABGF52_11295 [Candidatus Asgardarchaeum sp.]
MPNVTFSINDELYSKMKKHKEINWSAVVRKAISDFLRKLESKENIIKMKELKKKMESLGINLEDISLENAIKHYEKMREFEWKRFSTTQTS